jgi:hypothetical protein
VNLKEPPEEIIGIPSEEVTDNLADDVEKRKS